MCHAYESCSKFWKFLTKFFLRHFDYFLPGRDDVKRFESMTTAWRGKDADATDGKRKWQTTVRPPAARTRRCGVTLTQARWRVGRWRTAEDELPILRNSWHKVHDIGKNGRTYISQMTTQYVKQRHRKIWLRDNRLPIIFPYAVLCFLADITWEGRKVFCVCPK